MSGVDRISQLPDEIILHIFSFLPTTKLRARTSILSKRWRHIWTYHPSIHLSLSIPSGAGVDKDAAALAYAVAVIRCLKFSKALVLHQFSVDLCLPTSDTPDEANLYADIADLCFSFAGLRSVRELRIRAVDHRFQYDEYPTIPAALFCCDLVTDLRVNDGTFPNVPSDFHGFRFLKSLYLGDGSIDDQTLAFLLNSCPVLESLGIVGCSVLTEIGLPPWDLPRLTHLELCNCEDLMVASIDAPNLRSITYEGDLQYLFLYASPVEAALCYEIESVFDTQDDLMKLLISISTVCVLTTNIWFYQFEFTKPTVLNNLKELYLYIDDELTDSTLKVLITNIGDCPVLEKLDINLNYVRRQSLALDDKSLDLKYSDYVLKQLEEINERDWNDPPELFGVPSCTLCSLKTVIIREFVGSKNEMCMARYLLQNAVALENFAVFDFFEADDDQLEQLLAAIPRASSQVQLKLSSLENLHLKYGSGKHFWLFNRC